ncbi:MAG: EAL domain-containing protein [Rubrobacteraceae bacterium]
MQVYYQPKTDLRSVGTYGFEALVRSESSERGRISPDRFVPLAIGERVAAADKLLQSILVRGSSLTP